MVHTYRQGGYNIAIDVNSGAVHALDDATYRVLELMDNKPSNDSCPQEIIDKLSGILDAKSTDKNEVGLYMTSLHGEGGEKDE